MRRRENTHGLRAGSNHLTTLHYRVQESRLADIGTPCPNRYSEMAQTSEFRSWHTCYNDLSIIYVEQARVIVGGPVFFTSGSPARRGMDSGEPAAATNSAVWGAKIVLSASR